MLLIFLAANATCVAAGEGEGEGEGGNQLRADGRLVVFDGTIIVNASVAISTAP